MDSIASDKALEALASISSSDLEEVRIVVVDDSSDAAETLAILLRLHGYTVWAARDGDHALALVAEHHPQCVLYDVVMPGMSGSDLAKRLRVLHGDDIVLIAVTGCAKGDPRVGEAFAVADHHFLKPLDLDALKKIFPRV